jgi:hypothetical protein
VTLVVANLVIQISKEIMRTITLELLRHGPAHNQLLSPLTPYLALCENHAAVTLHVPVEHNQFLHRLTALGYKLEEESRVFHLNDTARLLGDILSNIPGLMAESGKNDSSDEPLTHLRLIISASELALLPFELSISPIGLPGSGQHLLLQPQMPICLTREIRRAPGEQFQWPNKPRILFIAASPPDVGQIPLESHLLTLRQVIAPWLKYYESNDKKNFINRLEEHLVFLPNASIEAIEKECSTNTFTHIHILAHGVEKQENYNNRFYLALHDAQNQDKTDYISGTRLATALRPSERPNSGVLAKPVVVTLASCDSGNVGSVAGAGASIAHALHESGIPMVVAGQFPLSFEGSVCLVDCLYNGLLWGTDPRPLLYDLRRRLYAQFPKRHDWASLTAYISLPPDFTSQLALFQIRQAMRSIEASMNHADEATRKLFAKSNCVTIDDKLRTLLENAKRKMNDSKTKLERLLTKIPSQKSQILRLLASTEKRQAEILFCLNSAEEVDDKKAVIKQLKKAKDYYWQTFLLDRSQSWAIVQTISLTLILYNKIDISKHEQENSTENRPAKKIAGSNKNIDQKEMQENLTDNAPAKKIAVTWVMAHTLATQDLRSLDKELVVTAHGLLIELYLLSLMLDSKCEGIPGKEEATQKALDYTEAFIEYAGRTSFSVYSTRRQIGRYIKWFNEISDIKVLEGLAKKIFNRFPEDVEEVYK